MSRFTVRVLPKARSDIDRILMQLAVNSQAGAAHWLNAFDDATRLLEDEPLAFGLASERLLRRLSIRDKLFRTRWGRFYRILYTVVDSEVRILRVRQPGQPPLKNTEL